jgi:hypothetical protein
LNFPFFYFIFYLNVPLKNFVCRWCAACTSHVFPNFFCLFGRWKSWNDFSLNCAKFSHSLAGVEIRLTNGGSDFATKSLGRRGDPTKELEPQWHATEGRQSSLVTKSHPNAAREHLWVPTSKTVRNEWKATTHFTVPTTIRQGQRE